MPRKGPKKVTRRDDRDLERCAERRKTQSATARAKTAEQVLNVYKTQSNPNIPTSKGERRALREALSAEGVSMERWNSGKFDECFFHIAKDRYVNNKFPDVYSAGDEESSPQWESDSWLQMYLHVPEDYREKVSKVIEPFCPSPCDENRVPFKNKTTTFRISRSQAKAMAEGTIIVHPTANINKGDPVSDHANKPALNLPADAKVTVPEGKVTITNLHNEVLCADATGKVSWRSSNDTTAIVDSVWSVEPTVPGKCNLRSAHGRFLCHCMWSGLVADRSSASWWEEWELSEALGNKPNPCESSFTLKSWRNVYVGKSGDKVVLTDTIDINCELKVVKAV